MHTVAYACLMFFSPEWGDFVQPFSSFTFFLHLLVKFTVISLSSSVVDSLAVCVEGLWCRIATEPCTTEVKSDSVSLATFAHSFIKLHICFLTHRVQLSFGECGLIFPCMHDFMKSTKSIWICRFLVFSYITRCHSLRNVSL